MSCKECGCFTLFKDLCRSCERASVVFDELATHQYAANQGEPVVANPVASKSLPLSHVNDASQKLNQIESPKLKKVEADTPPNANKKIGEVALKLGINLSELQGVFDISDIASTESKPLVPGSVTLVACPQCAQKIKEHAQQCTYCGFKILDS